VMQQAKERSLIKERNTHQTTMKDNKRVGRQMNWRFAFVWRTKTGRSSLVSFNFIIIDRESNESGVSSLLLFISLWWPPSRSLSFYHSNLNDCWITESWM
jgi:hypothetical protein